MEHRRNIFLLQFQLSKSQNKRGMDNERIKGTWLFGGWCDKMADILINENQIPL